MIKLLSTLCLSLLFFHIYTFSQDKHTTTVVINGIVYTSNQAQPLVQALAFKDGKIIFAGTNEDAKKIIEAGAEVIDAEGNFITPGFIDSHVHFIEGGFRLSSVQLRDAKTPEEFITRIKHFTLTLKPGEWITGGDWDHENWGGELPSKDWIDSVTQDNPVWINRLDGHMALANSYAMKIAGVSNEPSEIKGGSIVRNDKGEPTGIFKDNAMYLIDKVVEEPGNEQKDKSLSAAMKYVASLGITSIHNVSNWDDLETFKRNKENLTTRIYTAVPLYDWQKLINYIDKNGKGDYMLRVGALKGFVDGSLGSHTAAFFEPFHDDTTQSGFFVNTVENLYHWIKNADGNNLHVLIHAIGDRAINNLLDIYEKVIYENGHKDRRFRIEHSQHITPADIKRYGELNIIASMQPYHAIDDGRWAEKVIGSERIKTTYAFRSLLDNHAVISFGSDWYVAPPSPLEGIYAAVTRRTLDGNNPGGWVPEQKITVQEALNAYTIDAAYASFDEKIKGSIAEGKFADFVILDHNLLEIEPEEIWNVKVLKTFMNGVEVYGRDN